ncbi:MAG: Na(+)-translocating NADH-quinone reductase subunit A [Prevotellaceae bacterium]|jgi:Na+-transporting NADH:ubiquinone oxidoreductase subunit A|nr:Na(+)-translocating NADH-quinone reductase subunit A [Prevotellaceae bacterium]
MSRVIKIRKGLNIRLQGAAEKFLTKASHAERYAVKPSDFKGVTLRLCVKQGDAVKAGTPVLYDKNNPAVKIVSPVSGVVETINRGDRRKLLEAVIKPDAEQVSEKFNISEDAVKNREQIINLMLEAGLWAYVIQRPYGIIANPNDKPKAIFISGFDSAPLTVDMDFLLAGREEHFQKGIDILAKLTDGKVHLGLSSEDYGSKLNKVKNAEITIFSGKHPAGNVGVQIHHISPVNKGDIVWTIDAQHVAMLGRFFTTGVYNADKVVALCGSKVKRPQYMHIIAGAAISSISEFIDNSSGNVRYINGDVLTGSNIGNDGYTGFYGNRISVIPEGDRYEFLGWAMPRLNKFSASRSYFSWLTPYKSYTQDTNLNGGERAFVVTNQYEKVLPMDIYPVYLLKAILAENIEKMEQLGIYEVIEEDLALCEFVCTSKIEVQSIIRRGIDLMIKEMS